MKTLTLTLILLSFVFANSFAQTSAGIDLGMGTYIDNSENKLTLLDGHHIDRFFFGGLSFQYRYSENLLFGFDIDYLSNDIKGIFSDYFTGEHGEDLGKFDTDYNLTNCNFDFIAKYQFDEDFLIYGLGPSFVITNRSIHLNYSYNNHEPFDLLASSGLGLCALIEMPVKLSDEISFSGELKARYTHSIWFDKGIRVLDGYKQEFITVQLNMKLYYDFGF